MEKHAQNLTEKLIAGHLAGGRMETGEEIFLRVDSTLVHDMSGTLAYIGFEAMGIEKIQVPAAITFQDHNLVAMDHRSLDDHRFVGSAAKRYGSMLSKAGNGICHSVYYSRIGRPGMVLAGADSHSATAGALGMLGVGLGGLDVSAIMGGEPMELKMPGVIGVEVRGRLRPGVSAKDAALSLLRRLTVKGCVGKVLEYMGGGVLNLSVPQRATIANMGAEMGATSSVFPADEAVRRFLRAQDREADYIELAADPGAKYGQRLVLDLGEIVPSVAVPPMPDQVKSVREAGPIKVDQVYIGSCTNGSYYDLARAARVMEGRRVHPDVNLLVSPANRQVYQMLLEDGSIGMFLRAGARIMECGCGPCIGLGQAPPTGGVSVRTSNRNYRGRCGTVSAEVYLTGTETAAATAVLGQLAAAEDVMDDLAALEQVREPEHYPVDDSLLFRYDRLGVRPERPAQEPPSEHPPLIKGPNIREMPVKKPLDKQITARVVLKAGDNITTDDIIPPGPEVLTLRPNIPALSQYLFQKIDPDFARRAEEYGRSVIVAGENYGQGSSREHAAIGPMYLGVKAVLAKSISRIHRSNLINYGILPVLFADPTDYEGIEAGDELTIEDVPGQLQSGGKTLRLRNWTKARDVLGIISFTHKELELLAAGGLLPYIRNKHNGGINP